MVAAIIKLVAPYFYSTWGPAEAAGEVAQYGNEQAAASRTDSRLSHGSQATSVATSVATSAASTSLSPVSVLSAGPELMELGMVRHGTSRKSSFKAPAR